MADTLLGDITRPLSLNRYLYCLADPVNWTDPTGHRFAVAGKAASIIANLGHAKVSGNGGKTANLLSSARRAVSGIWKAQEALRRETQGVAARYLAAAQMYLASYRNLYCGSAEYLTYDRNAAIQYAKAYSWSTNFTGYFDGYYLLNGRNPAYPSFPQNCANFVSQVLVAGGFPQTQEWSVGRYVISYREDVVGWTMTRAWSLAKDQYEYFSNPANDYINGAVINVYKSTATLDYNQTNVPLNELPYDLRSLGIQQGDLMYFYNERGIHHATVISNVSDMQIAYSGNTINRFDFPLKDSLESSTDHGVLIVRLNDSITIQG